MARGISKRTLAILVVLITYTMYLTSRSCGKGYKIRTYLATLVLTTVVHFKYSLICILQIILLHYQTMFSLCPGEATATGGDITLKTVKDATWDARAKWDHLAINLNVDSETIKVSIGYCQD